MAKRLIVRTRCPLCGKHVDEVPDGELRRNPDNYDAEMVVTRTGYKQYIHSSCWAEMIAAQKRKNLDKAN